MGIAPRRTYCTHRLSRSLSIAPHQTKDVTLDYGTIGTEGEWLLNVKYVLKNAEGMLPAGHTVAYDQLTLKAYEAPALEFANVKESNQDIIVPEIDATNSNYLVVKGENFDIEFNKYTGYLTVYEVEGVSYLEPAPHWHPTSGVHRPTTISEPACNRNMWHGRTPASALPR